MATISRAVPFTARALRCATHSTRSKPTFRPPCVNRLTPRRICHGETRAAARFRSWAWNLL